jgi:hypothetical protein
MRTPDTLNLRDAAAAVVSRRTFHGLRSGTAETLAEFLGELLSANLADLRDGGGHWEEVLFQTADSCVPVYHVERFELLRDWDTVRLLTDALDDTGPQEVSWAGRDTDSLSALSELIGAGYCSAVELLLRQLLDAVLYPSAEFLTVLLPGLSLGCSDTVSALAGEFEGTLLELVETAENLDGLGVLSGVSDALAAAEVRS